MPVGYWTTVKFSGALPARRVNELLDRIERLQQAVKFAREEANAAEVADQRAGDPCSAICSAGARDTFRLPGRR